MDINQNTSGRHTTTLGREGLKRGQQAEDVPKLFLELEP